MHPSKNMSKVIDKKRYSIKGSTLLSGDDYWDGHNFERGGTNTFLYRTLKGGYFFVGLTQWMGRDDTITPCDIGEAEDFFDGCREDCQRVSRGEAFPGVIVPDA